MRLNYPEFKDFKYNTADWKSERNQYKREIALKEEKAEVFFVIKPWAYLMFTSFSKIRREIVI